MLEFERKEGIYVKCKKCSFENPIKANYCRSCGAPFSEEDRKAAYDRTFFGKLDQIENVKGWLDLSKITGNIFFRIAVLAVLAVLVIVNVQKNGSSLAIRNSDQYSIAYAKELDEYYLLTERARVEVEIYLPKQTDSLTLRTVQDNAVLSVETVDPEQGITLVRREDGYYVLTADYTDGKEEQLLFFVCKGDAE